MKVCNKLLNLCNKLRTGCVQQSDKKCKPQTKQHHKEYIIFYMVRPQCLPLREKKQLSLIFNEYSETRNTQQKLSSSLIFLFLTHSSCTTKEKGCTDLWTEEKKVMRTQPQDSLSRSRSDPARGAG